MKKIITITVISAVCLILAVVGTFALITTEKSAVNIVTMGNVKIEAVQSGEPSNVKVVPAGSADWEVSLKNTGNQDAYVRVSFDKLINLASGVLGEPDVNIMQFDIDDDFWEYKDGFYYYKEPLKAGESSKPLFTKMMFDKSAGNMYQQATANAKVNVYATQVKNNGASATEALGWPEVN